MTPTPTPTNPPLRFRLDPKALFQSDSKRAEAHNQIAERSFVIETLQVALAQMTCYTHAESSEAKAHAYSQLEGARRFIDIWLNLGRPNPKPIFDDPKALKPI